jgi:hypothetical protein
MTIYSEGNRFFRDEDDGKIYVFNPYEKAIMIFGFRPFNKRYRFRDPGIFVRSYRFYLLSAYIYPSFEPIGREIMTGDYL